MDETATTAALEQALEIARTAWTEAHRGLPTNPLTRTADIVATAAIAASVLGLLDIGSEAITREATAAIRIARRVSERVSLDTPGNPMARTAEKASVGILAAGILNRLCSVHATAAT